MNVALIDSFNATEQSAKLRRPGPVEFLQRRLSALSNPLGDELFLDGERFTAGDLVSRNACLAAYVERCTARPAFKRALDAQLGDFAEAA